MSLVDEARGMQRKTGGPCAMQRVKQSDSKLYAEIMEALASEVDCASIHRALMNRETPVQFSRDILERHRRGDCVRCAE